MRVRLIPTGQCELSALARSLQAVFPGHEFETVHARREPDGRRVPFAGFTSVRLQRELNPDPLRKLVEQLAAEVLPGRAGRPADLALILDDLELDNADQVEVVASAVREAVRRHLAEQANMRGTIWAERVAEALRERASFHLAVPMVEAWFFGEAAALQRAGCPPSRLPAKLISGRDPELFATDDAAFSIDDGSHCAALHARNAKRRTPERARWLLPERPGLQGYRREAHPKAYLAWLCRDSEHERCSTYREAEGGAAALEKLSWREVLSVESHFTWARALIYDVAEALAVHIPELSTGEVRSFFPGRGGSGRVLRNV